MSKMIQVRNVPDEVHRELKMRAARCGESLSDFLLRELERIARRPSTDDVLNRIRDRDDVTLDETPVAAVRAERDARR